MTVHKKLTFFVAVISALLTASCVDDSKDSSQQNVTDDNFDFIAMFANYADSIIVPNYQAVADRAGSFVASGGPVAEYCMAIGSANEVTARALALASWEVLQAAIQTSESHIVGPVTDNGESLRNRLNAFHSGALSTCGIDQAVVQASQDVSFNVSSRSLNQRGIAAAEYLLFNTDLAHSCPSQIVETQTWNGRSDTERKQLRCEYALLLGDDIANAANSLVEAWDVNGGNYRSVFINPVNAAENLAALSDAMFYLELEVKDTKLGIPTGINSACSGFACPNNVESPYTQTSLQHIRSNLEAFETMLTGGDGLGFDDIITQAGVSDLNDRFATHITAAINHIDGQTETLFAQVSGITDSDAETVCTNAFTNPATPSAIPACNLHGFVKRITDELKVGFVAAVNVDLPDRSQSDND